VLEKYLADWPGACQVFQVHRVRVLPGRTEEEVSYGVTSLGPGEAGAARLLGLNRGHWGVENHLHRARDVAFGEDACRVRSGDAPQVLAATRNALIHLLGQKMKSGAAAAMRRFVIRPLEALGLISSKPEH
jgi:hypothetical protein